MRRTILHMDVDAFLASVEQALHPELRGKPVVVGGAPTDRNLVMSCSYEARPFGVRPGLLLPEAKRLCPQAIFRRGDSQAANRLREQIARIAFEYTPRVEITSIDDLFVDLTGAERLNGRAFDVAETIKNRVRDEAHLPLTIGVGINKTLARLAGKLAKPGGIAEIWPGAEEAFLRHLPVEHLPGAGHRITPLLERFGVHTVGQLCLASRELLFSSFGSNGLLLYDRARGIDPDPVEPSFTIAEDGALEMRPPKSIRRDSTFEPEEGRRGHVEAMLGYLVDRAAHRLRSTSSACGSIEVRLSYVDTRSPSLRRASRAAGEARARPERRRRTLDPPTDATDALWDVARELLRSLPRRRALVKRVGLTLHRLRPAKFWQRSLFSTPTDTEREVKPGDPKQHAESRADRGRRLDDVLDEIRERHGFGGVIRGASLPLKIDHAWTKEGFRLRTPSLNQ